MGNIIEVNLNKSEVDFIGKPSPYENPLFKKTVEDIIDRRESNGDRRKSSLDEGVNNINYYGEDRRKSNSDRRKSN